MSEGLLWQFFHKCHVKLYSAKLMLSLSYINFSGLEGILDGHYTMCTVVGKISIPDIFVRKGRLVIQTKDKRDHPKCYYQQVQKSGPVMV